MPKQEFPFPSKTSTWLFSFKRNALIKWLDSESSKKNLLSGFETDLQYILWILTILL